MDRKAHGSPEHVIVSPYHRALQRPVSRCRVERRVSKETGCASRFCWISWSSRALGGPFAERAAAAGTGGSGAATDGTTAWRSVSLSASVTNGVRDKSVAVKDAHVDRTRSLACCRAL